MIDKEDFSIIEEYLNGIDSDDYEVVIITPKRRQRRLAEKKYNKRLEEIYNNNSCVAGEIIKKTNHKGEDYYFSGNRSTQSKKIKVRANRKVRKTKGKVNHGTYKKLSEYWWDLI